MLPFCCTVLITFTCYLTDWLELQCVPHSNPHCQPTDWRLLYLECVLPPGSCSSFKTQLCETFQATYQDPMRALAFTPHLHSNCFSITIYSIKPVPFCQVLTLTVKTGRLCVLLFLCMHILLNFKIKAVKCK